MARTAGAALLAAVEVFNKPSALYREQTFALLATNAWEILLKARLVEQANGKLRVIQRRDPTGRGYVQLPETGEILTIGLREALGQVGLPAQVAANIRGLALVRNSAVHLGTLAPELGQRVLEFGTASVHNFLRLSTEWFGESVEIPFLLPVGFLGRATIARGAYPKAQRDMLRALTSLCSETGIENDEGYSVVLNIEVQLNRRLTGGGSIGITSDHSAPRVQVGDEEFFQHFSCTYNELSEACASRYGHKFSRNREFHEALKAIKADPSCAHLRSLNPKSSKSQKQFFYSLDGALQKLDQLYLEPSSSN